MAEEIAEILISKEQIEARVAELGRKISEDYLGKELVLVGILKGAVVFLADLMRQISIPLLVDFVAISSYGPSTRSSGVVKILKDLDESVENKHVLIVEDIIDTGLTLKLSYLKDNLERRKAASVKICTLLDKPARRQVDIEPDYKGFTIPDKFVVGYGLDFGGLYRNLPFIGVLKEEIFKQRQV
ncbi:MAG: hypoxanthine phosphoribosyltransferase [Armatimonadetes bacterium]|nr:hypoxanthine phosphoribosyltransferase [Armatimonadota bacterium]